MTRFLLVAIFILCKIVTSTFQPRSWSFVPLLWWQTRWQQSAGSPQQSDETRSSGKSHTGTNPPSIQTRANITFAGELSCSINTAGTCCPHFMNWHMKLMISWLILSLPYGTASSDTHTGNLQCGGIYLSDVISGLCARIQMAVSYITNDRCVSECESEPPGADSERGRWVHPLLCSSGILLHDVSLV